MRTTEERLRNHYRKAKQAGGAPPSSTPASGDEGIDFNLLSRYADGTASELDTQRIETEYLRNPALAGLVESHVEAQITPRTGILPFVQRSYRLVAVAASVLLAAGIGWHMYRPARPIAPTGEARDYSVHITPRPEGKGGYVAKPTAPVRERAMTKGDVVERDSKMSTRADKLLANADIDNKAVGVSKSARGSVTAGKAPAATTPAPVMPHNAYALLIGVDRNEADPLGRNGAVADVQQVASKLNEFEFNRVITLTNATATTAGISKALDELQVAAGTNASLFVYCAGDAPNDEDIVRNDCIVPFDNAKMAPEKNMMIADVVASSTPSVYNNSFIVYDNRVPRSQAQRLNRISQRAMNIMKNTAPRANQQVMLNVQNTERNVSNIFASAFVAALDRTPGNDMVSAVDVQNYVACQQDGFAMDERDILDEMKPAHGTQAKENAAMQVAADRTTPGVRSVQMDTAAADTVAQTAAVAANVQSLDAQAPSQAVARQTMVMPQQQVMQYIGVPQQQFNFRRARNAGQQQGTLWQQEIQQQGATQQNFQPGLR